MDGYDLKSVSDEALITLFHTAPVIHQLGSIRIVRISKDLVIKGGEDIRASEAATMDYASAMTDVLLPKVHRVVHRDPDKIWGETCLIVMDFIQGSTLHDCWETLNEETRANIVNQVAKYISSLQAVQVAEPPGPIGGRDKFQGIWFSYYGAGPLAHGKPWRIGSIWRSLFASHGVDVHKTLRPINSKPSASFIRTFFPETSSSTHLGKSG